VYKIEELSTRQQSRFHGPVSARWSQTAPEQLVLYDNFPNPFNPATTIVYEIPELSQVKLAIYNLAGQEVCILHEGELEPGIYQSRWNGRDSSHHPLPSGLYLYRLSAGKSQIIRKMTFIH
jgi:hypothetical protein